MADPKTISLRAKKKRAEEHLLARRLPEARAAFAQLCQLTPGDYDGWLNLGAIDGMLGNLGGAEAAFKRALTLRSDESRVYFNLARLCDMQGRAGDAIDYWLGYLRVKPEDADAYAQIGRLLHKAGRSADGVDAMREALRRDPDEANYHNNVGVMLFRLGCHEEALASYQNALRLQPEMDEVYCNIGNLYHNMGNGELAISSYSSAIKINPHNATAHMNLGFHLARSGNNDEGLHYLREALRLQPNYPGGHWNLALLLLLLGKLREGWLEYEWRFQCDEIRREDIITRLNSRPMWDGSPLTGETLLVYVEQGFGDALQFCRYLPLVRQRVERVVFECHTELLRLMQGSPALAGVELVARPADGALPMAGYDLQIPLLSLPRIFETALESMPQTAPYIQADPQQVDTWRQRLEGDGFKVGLVWAGNPDHRRDHCRSLSLAALAPLGQIDGIRFYSLQKGAAAAEAATPPAGMRLIDLAPELNDFATTAAVIANLDLVITVDTSVAHLAGAMGRPVWTLIYAPPDWRWLLERDDSPWYPTMRLFRREIAGEWQPVIERIEQALRRISSM